MRGPQRIVSIIVGLVIIVGGYGCRYALRQAADDTADRVTRDAIDDAYSYQAPTTRPRPTTEPVAETTTPAAESTTTTTTPAPVEDEDALPKGWPAGLVLVEGLDVQSTSDLTGPGVTGHVKGDLVAVTEAVRADLTEAGFAVDATTSTDPAVGGGGSVTRAVGPAGSATVLISPVPETPGALLVSYQVELAA